MVLIRSTEGVYEQREMQQKKRVYLCPKRALLFRRENFLSPHKTEIALRLSYISIDMFFYVFNFAADLRDENATPECNEPHFLGRENVLRYPDDGSIDHFQSTDDEPWKIDFKVAVYSAQAYIR